MFVLRAGVICVQDGKILLVTGNHLRFMYSPGGAVNAGEDAAGAAAREWREETGRECGPLRLVGVLESFFQLDGQRWHEIGFYFQTEWSGPPLSDAEVGDTPGERLEWFPLEQVSPASVYPSGLAEFIGIAEGELRHLVVRE